MPSKFRHKPTLTQAGTFQKLSSFMENTRNSLPKVNRSPMQLFWGLVAESRTSDFSGLLTASPISLYAMATAFFSSLAANENQFPMALDYEGSQKLAIVAATDAEGVSSDDYVDAKEAKKDNEEVVLTDELVLNLVATFCQNAAYQGDFTTKVVNQLVIAGIYKFGDLGVDTERIDSLFKEQANILPYDYFLILMALWGTALVQSLNFHKDHFLKDNANKERLKPLLDYVFNELSLEFDQYKSQQAETGFSQFSGKSLPLALFSRWPLIRFNEVEYVAPSHAFLKIQLSSKLVTKALAFARSSEGKDDSNFSQYLGETRLEPYFRELCDIWNPSGGHFDEYPYKKGTKGPDRIAFEKHGQSQIAHLFQVKMKSLTAHAHYGVSITDVEENMKKGIAKLIGQSIKFLVALEEAEASGKLTPEFSELSKRILKADKYCLIGIVPDLPPIFIFNKIREMAIKTVEETLNEKEKAWFQTNFEEKCIWHIMELTEFQTFLCVEAKWRDFYKHLYPYLENAKVDDLLIDSSQTIPRDFRSYVISRRGDIKKPNGEKQFSKNIPQIQELYEKLQTDLSNMFFNGRAIHELKTST